MKPTPTLFLTLIVVWLLWSGHYTPMLLGFGTLSALGVVALCRRMRIVDPESIPIHLTARYLRYLPWLLGQVALANLDTVRKILSFNHPVRPLWLEIRASQRTDLGRATFANSITLTPGTVTVDARGRTLAVHALTLVAADSLLSGEMDRRVNATERPVQAKTEDGQPRHGQLRDSL